MIDTWDSCADTKAPLPGIPVRGLFVLTGKLSRGTKRIPARRAHAERKETRNEEAYL